MKNKIFNRYCPRIKTLKDEFIDDLSEINIQGKSLIIIGSIVFIITIVSEFLPHNNVNIAMQFRGILASIFGFLLSSTTSPQKYIDELSKKELNRSDCIDDIKNYKFKCGNLVQILIALVIAIVCIFAIWLLIILNTNCSESCLTQLTDLMCTSVGFLLGEARINRK